MGNISRPYARQLLSPGYGILLHIRRGNQRKKDKRVPEVNIIKVFIRILVFNDNVIRFRILLIIIIVIAVLNSLCYHNN